VLQPQTKVHRYLILDGLRGVAALVVLAFHLVQQHDLTALPLAGLAVDFFYLLSGFVIAFAYEGRLQSGAMTLRSFAWVRITRLYPLAVLGTSAGIALGLLAAMYKTNVTYHDIAVSGILGLLLLPSYVFPQWATAYPFNMASWSLTFELVVNLIYGMIAPYLTSSRLAKLTVCSAVVLVWVAAMNHGIAGGNDQSNFAYGFGRVMFPFFAGILLYRCRRPQRLAPWISFGLLLSLPVLLLAPVHQASLTSLIYVLLLFPAIIMAGAAIAPGPRLAPVCEWMGALSYPVYILQGPVLRAGEELLKHWQFGMRGSCLFGLAEASVVAAVAWFALRFYDKPLQRRFRMRATPRLSAATLPKFGYVRPPES
jgi:peptidoglycan/LPS O-acetylase OafA/YrhL